MKSRRHIARPGKHRAQILGIGMDRRQPIFRSQFSNLVSTRNDNGIVSDGRRIGVFIHCFFERNLDILRLFQKQVPLVSIRSIVRERLRSPCCPATQFATVPVSDHP